MDGGETASFVWRQIMNRYWWMGDGLSGRVIALSAKRVRRLSMHGGALTEINGLFQGKERAGAAMTPAAGLP